MVERDPETGQFVPSGMANDAVDEILVLKDGATFDETSTMEEQVTGAATLTAGRDYKVHGVRADLIAVPETYEQTSESAPGAVTSSVAQVRNQLSIRSAFAGLGGDNEVPSGVAFDETSFVSVHGNWKDNTNGNAGSFPGYSERNAIAFAVDDIPTWSGTLEEGTDMKMHWQLDSLPNGQIQLYAENYLFAETL